VKKETNENSINKQPLEKKDKGKEK